MLLCLQHAVDVLLDRSDKEQLERFRRLLPDSHGQNEALTVLHVPYSLGGGPECDSCTTFGVFTHVCFVCSSRESFS